jgi:hypothetical protein
MFCLFCSDNSVGGTLPPLFSRLAASLISLTANSIFRE